MADALHIPDDWQAAIGRIAAEGAERVVVIGSTDCGKSSFVRALLAADPSRDAIDADPGQKLVGPPGTVSLGRPGAGGEIDPAGFVFIGSTSAANIFLIARACEALARGSPRFVANTSGFIERLGARLQAATISALDADLIVAFGSEETVAPILDRHGARSVLRLRPSPQAARKTPGMRARLREGSFEAALAGAAPLALDGVRFEPAPPIAFDLGGRHPVCALADAEGTDMALGVLEAADGGSVRAIAPPPPRPVAILRLGSMWAEPQGGGWRLLDTLHPSWLHDEPEG